MAFCLFFFNFFLLISIVGGKINHSPIIDFLCKEQCQCTEIQSTVIKALEKRGVSISSAVKANPGKPLRNMSDIVIVGVNDDITCRISLDKPPIGSKCVAPCACTGSQKWVQFSLLNKLRRKDPQQWMICPTCRQKLQFQKFIQFGGPAAAVLDGILNNLSKFRSLFLAFILLTSQYWALSTYFEKFLVSDTMWHSFPYWSKLVHIPFGLKVWLTKLLVQKIFSVYVLLEKDWIIAKLAELESRLIEHGFSKKLKNVQQ